MALCNICETELNKRILKCKDWEVKRKKCYEDYRKEHSSNPKKDCPCRDNGTIPHQPYGGGKFKYCKRCKEQYNLEQNGWGDWELDKHDETCSQKDDDDNKPEPDKNNPPPQNQGWTSQLGNDWVGCPYCEWKRQLTKDEKDAPADNKIKKCESCDSTRILFYENEPFKSSDNNRERERAKSTNFELGLLN